MSDVLFVFAIYLSQACPSLVLRSPYYMFLLYQPDLPLKWPSGTATDANKYPYLKQGSQGDAIVRNVLTNRHG